MVDYNLQVPGIAPVQNSMAQMNPMQMMLLGQQLQTNQLAFQEDLRKRQAEQALAGIPLDPSSPEYVRAAARISPQFGLQALTSQRQAEKLRFEAQKESRQAEESRVRTENEQANSLKKKLDQLYTEARTIRDQASYDRVVKRMREISPNFEAPAKYDPEFVRVMTGIELKFEKAPDGRLIATNPLTGRSYDASGGKLVPMAAPDTTEGAALGSGQPVNVPPGAPTGTPRITPNNAAPGQAAPAAAAPSGGQAPFDISRAKQAIANIESSGGNYGAIGPVTKSGDRAYGKYQVMGNNIPSWTREALGYSMTPAEFLRDQDAQEKVFEHHFGKSVQKYGNVADAASVWFSGRPIARAGNAADVLGTTVPKYVSQFMASYESGKPDGRRPPMMTTAPAFATTGGLIPAGFTGAAAAPMLNAMSPELMNALATPTPQQLTPAGVPAGTPAPVEGQPASQQPASQQPAPFGKAKEQEGKQRVGDALRKMAQAYQALENQGAITSTKRGAFENIGAYLRSTPPGQIAERAVATEAQVERDFVIGIVSTLKTEIKNATGMSSKEIDSIPEMQALERALTNPSQSTQTISKSLNFLNERYGTGVKLDIKERAEPAPKESGVPRGRRGAEAPAAAQPQQQQRVPVKTGMYGDRRVVQYSDGSVEYAD